MNGFANGGSRPLADFINEATLQPYYSPAAAAGIAQYIRDFQPFSTNFNSIVGQLYRQEQHQLLLLNCQLLVQAAGRDSTIHSLNVGVIFPAAFPSVPPHCTIVPVPNHLVKNPHAVVTPSGVVQLQKLPLLAGSAPPYSLCEILVAMTEQFELDYPLVVAGQAAAAPPPSGNLGLYGGIAPLGAAPGSCPAAQPPLGGASGMTAASRARAALLRRAAEVAEVHLKSKAEAYLDTREQALEYISRLYQSGSMLRDLQLKLSSSKDALQAALMQTGQGIANYEALKPHKDSIAERSSCIVPVDSTHAHALSILADVHSAQDQYNILEKARVAGVLPVDSYVMLVSDVARAEFMSRFLLDRIAAVVRAERTSQTNTSTGHSGAGEASAIARKPPTRSPPRGRYASTLQSLRAGKGLSSTHPLPNRWIGEGPEVPKRLNNAVLLREEFPFHSTSAIELALRQVGMNLREARKLLLAQTT